MLIRFTYFLRTLMGLTVLLLLATTLHLAFPAVAHATEQVVSAVGNAGEEAARIAHAAFEKTTPVPTVNAEKDSPLETIKRTEYTVPEKGKAVKADLSAMQITLYEDGKLVRDLPIISIGRQGTAWETPPGNYSIKTLEENHYSSIGEVWMPYSMQFFGNYFIHGWPYYANGKAVGPGYSGGCIRLNTEDALAVYEFVDVGTPISVIRAQGVTLGAYTPKPSKIKKVEPTARGYLVADIETGNILTSREPDRVFPIASVTKLATALVSLETINQYKEVTVSKSAIATDGSFGNLVRGEKLTTGDLLYPLLIESSNDAAEALAEYHGRSYFLRAMNDKAVSLGLTRTQFADPSGLSAENVSTAKDLFTLVQYLYENKQYVLEITKLREKKLKTADRSHHWLNNNPLVREKLPSYAGGKHGYTPEAGKTLVGIVDLPVGEFETRTLVVVLLQSTSLDKDTDVLLQHVRNSFLYGPGAQALAN